MLLYFCADLLLADGLFYHFHGLEQLLADRRTALDLADLSGILFESGIHHIHILGLEENVVARRVSRGIFFQGIVDVVFTGNFMKLADILVCDLNVGQLILSGGQISQSLFAPDRLLLLTGSILFCQIICFHLVNLLGSIGCCRAKSPGRQLASADAEGNGLAIDIFLHGKPPFWLSLGTANPVAVKCILRGTGFIEHGEKITVEAINLLILLAKCSEDILDVAVIKL